MQDADSDDEWQTLIDATDCNVRKVSDILSVFKDKSFVQKLKSRLSSSSAQVLDAVLEGASRLRPVLQILCNILMLKWFDFIHFCPSYLVHYKRNSVKSTFLKDGLFLVEMALSLWPWP